MRYGFLAICAGTVLLGLLPGDSLAGEYTVYSCRADDSGRNRSWAASSTSSHLTAYPDGCGASGGGLVSRAGVEPAGSTANPFDAASWRFDAPPGASVSQASVSGRMYRASGGTWGVGLLNQAGTYFLGGISSDAMAWESGGYSSVVTPDTTTLYFAVICASGSGCPTTSTGNPTWGYTRARADLFGARVRVSDSTAPAIGAVRGSLASGSWVGGTASIGFDSSDNVGIASQSYSLGAAGQSDPKACDYALAVPCPTPSGADFLVDTRAVPDGERTVTLTARDTAGNPANRNASVYIDNAAPGAASQPVLQGTPASQWRAENGFTLTYDNPSRAGGAPLSSHDVQLCPTDSSGNPVTSQCSLRGLAGAPGSDTVDLPSPGRYRVRVRVNDSLYAGSWSPWSEVLRFDNVAPGSPGAAFPARWVNASASRGSLALSPPSGAERPISGISRYVVAGVGPSGSLSVDAGTDETGGLPYSAFPEGESPISVRAVSGAGLSTPPARATGGEVRKDTTAPSLAVAGAPAPGSVVPYVVTLRALAEDGVSGMTPAPADQPAGDGGLISFTSPGGAPAVFRGASAQFAPGEGHQSVSIAATDVAGNQSPTTTASYTQDTRIPTGGLIAAPSDAPSVIRFLVSESCAGEAAIELSASPGVWVPLVTTLADGIATSRVPDEVWDQEAPYTLRANVTDCAGNHAILDTWASGPLSGQPIGELRPPSRRRTAARVSVQAPPKRSRASAASSRVVRGTLRAPDGSPVAGATVIFEAQPRTNDASWRTVATATSSRSGAVGHTVSNPCSQRIRIRVVETDVFAASTSNTVDTTVRASSSISTRPSRLRNGRRLQLSGRLRGGHVPASFEITLYGRGPGSRSWVPVRSPVAVSRAGRWQVGYRFTRTRARTRYLFRVRIPARPDYPFARGYSATRAVTVAP